MKSLLSIVVIIFLSSCSPALKFQESFTSKDLNFNSLKNSSITVYGVSNIVLKEFKQTFTDEYSDTTKLNNKIITDFKTEFSKQIPALKVKSGEGKIPSALTGEISFKDFDQAKIQDFFGDLNSDYLIFVSSLDIGNAYDTYTHFNPATNMSSSSSTEKCMVETEIECWDVKKQNKIFKIKSYGSSTVILFTFLNSLNSAISEAIENGVKYIADDGKK
jgi:hypothetical protein